MLNCKRLRLLAVLSLLFVLSSAAQASPSLFQGAGDPQLDAVVEKAMRQHNVPGAAVAVVKNGAVAWAKGYGMADPALGKPVLPETVFDAASVSKPVTAWGIMKLVEAGLLDLDAPIERYVTRWHLPPSAYDHNLITIRRILSHTAGLSTDGDTGVDPDAAVPTVEEALNGAVLGMRPLHVAYPPGEDYHYSSVGYTLLEIAVEEVTGEPFSSYMQREILDPLGMVNSNYEWTPQLRANAAIGHDWYNRPLPFYQYATRAQGRLHTTATDLAIFLAASLPGPNGEPIGRGVLTPASVAETLTPVPFAKAAESSHSAGLGYDLIRVDDTIVGARKTGDNRGYKPIIVMAGAANEGIAIMTNSDRAAIGFLIDIVCAWSANVPGKLMQNDCGELYMIRNGQVGLAALLALGALIYAALVVRSLRSGRRQLSQEITRGKVIRWTIFVIILALWWLFWHTDLWFTRIMQRYPCCGYAVTVRAIVPWPTAFVWISWAVTLWFVMWIGVNFVPKKVMKG